jgi:hypothetical protein
LGWGLGRVRVGGGAAFQVPHPASTCRIAIAAAVGAVVVALAVVVPLMGEGPALQGLSHFWLVLLRCEGNRR